MSSEEVLERPAAGGPADPLATPLQFIKGAGPHRAELLARMGLRTAGDLLWFLPRDYLDLTDVRSVRALEPDKLQSVHGRVVDLDGRRLPGGRTLSAVLIDCGDGYVRGVWFNQSWILPRFQPNARVMFSGKPKRHQGRWEFAHPQIQWLTDDDLFAPPEGAAEDDDFNPPVRASGSPAAAVRAAPSAVTGILPLYSLTEGLRMHEMRRIVRNVVEQFADLVADPLPEGYRSDLGISRLGQALRQVHLPRSADDVRQGRRSLVLHDLLDFQIALGLRRRYRKRMGVAAAIAVTPRIDARIRRLFPFRFTAGQERAVQEICADLARRVPMHRLLQADVGAGKTAVAVYALLAAVAYGHQAAFMAPTELLALQHWQTLEDLLRHSRVERLLLTGQLTAAQRAQALERIRNGTVQLVCGTQALIQQDVTFGRLGVVVIDEQHKFGVRQRARFHAGPGDVQPHMLVMTATPIPRSLCLTQFGDLDLTVIPDLPPGRRPVSTSLLQSEREIARAWEFIRKKLREGQQAFVVCPRVESEAEHDDASAESIWRQLTQGELQGFRVGLVHGRQDRDLREQTMAQFRAGSLQALVATTVVEVGVDVPNASLMLIYNAERFGLSQLHQLRGRVGRSSVQGYCFLLPTPGRPEAAARLEPIVKSHDGFAVAEADFQQRGPGDVLGTRQHGEMPLRVADLVRDGAELAEARRAAWELVDGGQIDAPEFLPLKLRVLERFAEQFELSQTG